MTSGSGRVIHMEDGQGRWVIPSPMIDTAPDDDCIDDHMRLLHTGAPLPRYRVVDGRLVQV